MEPSAPDPLRRTVSESERFATAVLSARTQRHMSRLALAELAGVSLQVVEELERGYPVSREIVTAICRNLELPEPALDSSPAVRLALQLRERRGQARLARSQVASMAGLTSGIIRSLETATLWPSHEVCMALLSVKRLQLQESDVAEFLRQPTMEADRDVPSGAPIPPPASAAPQRTPERSASTEMPASRHTGPDHPDPARPSRGAPGNQVVATFVVRLFANGKVSLEMRPAKPRREAPPTEGSRGGSRGVRVSTDG